MRYFLPYQDRWIDDDSPLKIAEKSRRVGFTFASTYRMFRKCLLRGDGFTQWVSSRDLLTAQELIRDYVSKWCEVANISARGISECNARVFQKGGNIRAFTVEFPGGSRIVSLSSSPEAFAGKGGDVFLDEVDLHEQPGKLIDMAYPCITWGGQLEMVSAYRVGGSKFTPFARVVAKAKGENPMNASLHRVTIHDAVEAGIVEKINEVSGRRQTREEFVRVLKAGCRTLDAWKTQFECVLLDAGDRLLPSAVIEKCIEPESDIRGVCDNDTRAHRFAGFDVARRKHASVWHCYAQIGKRLWLEEREVLYAMPFRDQEAFIRRKMRRESRRVTRLCMDSTGLGMEMAENMAREFVGRVDQVNLESHRRHEVCMITKDFFDKRSVAIPDIDRLCEDLNAPQIVISDNGNIRVRIPQFEVMNDDGEDSSTSHADEFMASALALSGVDNAANSDASPVDMRGGVVRLRRMGV